ncbi:hypothetical protein [Roseimicrobium sp. ORNL1]|uniref:hypothetical protein n=1 Tax=Roseimicrobium sp. ORNL1 TaxID=2711231 RepID=UPI00197F9384|nr:hypothetical protein [Roseimicrobium sp. ORNL1]
MREDVTHINTPLSKAERAALEKVARSEGRSLGRQIRQFTATKLLELGFLERDPATGTVSEGGMPR